MAFVAEHNDPLGSRIGSSASGMIRHPEDRAQRNPSPCMARVHGEPNTIGAILPPRAPPGSS